MRKCILSLLLSAATIFFPGRMMSQTFWDGTTDDEWAGEGTSTSPYLITSAAELAGLAKRTNKGETFEGKYIQLAADIWLSDESMPADERPEWIPIASHDISNDDAETNPGGWYATNYFFKGVFDGAGHTIHNLWFNGSTNFDDFDDPFGSGEIDFSSFNKALFGGLEGATIKNLNVKNVNVNGAIVAGFAIEAYDTNFTDVYIDGHVKSGDIKNGGTAAGIVKEAYNCNFLRCESNVDVYSYSGAAPFVSSLKAGSTVIDCKAGGTATGCVYASGFISSASDWEEGNDMRVPVIRNCSSSGLVTVIPGRNQGNYGGGFIGINSGEIYNCFSTSDLHVTTDVGAGFCVDNRGRIESCYALGNLYNEEYGVSLSAFVSDNGLDAGWSEYYPGIILNCYAAGILTAPDAPTDVIATPTRLWGFGYNNVTPGSQMANCYYDSTKNPKIEGTYPTIGSYGVSTEYMKSKEFVDELNAMAAVMGTTLWAYNQGGYPTSTDVKATDASRYFGKGDGTEANPFIVSNKEELENLAFVTNRNWPFRGQYIRQTADIALNPPFETWGEEMPVQWTPIGEQFIESERGGTYHFCGTYDGGMHTIANLYIDDEKKLHCGLFGTLGAGAEIKNLGVTDAWITCGSYSGILAGAARIHNEADQYAGPSKISHCWTTGQIIQPSSWGFSPGGIIGYVPYNGDFTMDACYSTATAANGLIGDGVADETFINGSYFAGQGSLLYSQNYFWTFIDKTINPSIVDNVDTRWALAQMGRTTEYMQSPQFVNDLNYAAAYKGYEGGWKYNENGYPSFTSGTAPSVALTLNDGVNAPLTFKVIPGTSISLPVAPEKEGEVCLGWYCDKDMTKVFEFGKTLISEPTELYAQWATTVTPDVSIFKNKFTDTYTIKTVEQLYGFAAVVNGTTEEVDKTDFTDKTIKLGSDLVLNDVEDFEHWGTNVNPVSFPCIGNYDGNTSKYVGFNGTFDGQGYTITGLYLKEEKSGDKGLFRMIGSEGVVKNVVLKNAYLDINTQFFYGGLLAAHSEGVVSRCGVEGKIMNNYIDTRNPAALGGLIGYIENDATLTESYAVVDIASYNSNTGGLFALASNTVTISDNFVRGSVHFDACGGFGSIGYSTNNQNMSGVYGALSLSWKTIPTSMLSIGGAYNYNQSFSPTNPVYYNKELVAPAFDLLDSTFAEIAFNRGTGLNTLEMQRMDSYPGWDFNTVWGRRNDINDGYPYLRWTAPGLTNDADGSGVCNIETDNNADVIIYDLQGYPVYKGIDGRHTLPAGIYIKQSNGKTLKIVVR